MNFDDLWIGDLVYIPSLGKNGKWEGLADTSHARVRVGHTILTIAVTDIAEAKTEEEVPFWKLNSTSKEPLAPAFDRNEIDLHIERLQPDLVHQSAEQILLFQLKKCRAFIEFAINKKWVSITVIHGKGTGLLKEEVYHLIKGYPEVFHTVEKK